MALKKKTKTLIGVLVGGVAAVVGFNFLRGRGAVAAGPRAVTVDLNKMTPEAAIAFISRQPIPARLMIIPREPFSFDNLEDASLVLAAAQSLGIPQISTPEGEV